MSRRALGIAVAVSVLIHGIALTTHGWHLPDAERSGSPPLSAVLLAPPSPDLTVPVPKLAPKTPPVQKQKPVAEVSGEDSGVFEPRPERHRSEGPPPGQEQNVIAEAGSAPMTEASAAQSEVAAAPPEVFDLSAWVGKLRVRYQASYFGLPVVAELTWSHDERTYSASLHGRVPIKGEILHQESTGRVAHGKPVPELLRETFNKAEYETRFDTEARMIRQVRKSEPRELLADGYALDLLSLMQFMALQVPDAEDFDVFVVAFRGSVSRVTVQQGQLNLIELPVGSLQARPFHAEARNGALKIDIWLAPEWGNAPVRIRIADEGGVYDLKADEVEIDGKIVARMTIIPSGS